MKGYDFANEVAIPWLKLALYEHFWSYIADRYEKISKMEAKCEK